MTTTRTAQRTGPQTWRSRPLVIGAAAALALAALGLASVGTATKSELAAATAMAKRKAAATARALQPASRVELESVLLRSGLSPEALAAAGATAEQVTVIATNGIAAVQASIQSLRTAEIAAGTAREEKERLERQQRGGLLSPEELATLRSARATLVENEAAARAILESVYADGVSGLTAESRRAMDAIRTSESWDLPEQFRTEARTETQWLALRDALADQRIAGGRAADPGNAQLLAQISAAPGTASAIGRMASLEQVRAAWNTAMRTATGR